MLSIGINLGREVLFAVNMEHRSLAASTKD
jgi:hypothetical protein